MQIGSMSVIGQFAQTFYQIEGRRVMARTDFDKNEIMISAHGFCKTFSMDEYMEFNGNMEDFARAKLKEGKIIT